MPAPPASPRSCSARVHVLPFGAMQSAGGAAPGGKPVEEMLAGLRSAAGFLRGQLGRELKLRQAPRLQFELDTQLLHAHELSELIDKAVKGQPGPREEPDSDEQEGT